MQFHTFCLVRNASGLEKLAFHTGSKDRLVAREGSVGFGKVDSCAISTFGRGVYLVCGDVLQVLD